MIKSDSMKKVCFFGIYDAEYPRNKVIIDGLVSNGYEIVHCQVNPREHKGLKKYWLLAQKSRQMKSEKFDLIWVAFPGHTCVWLAKLLFHRTTIIFDIFLSLYEANVSDRKVHKKRSLSAFKDRFLDWYGLRLADIVTIDTDKQIEMFGLKYGLKKEKAIRIFLSSALPPVDKAMVPNTTPFLVHFHGSFIPLHGVEYVIRAAKILENEKDIMFKMIGGGQQLQEMKSLAESLKLTNIEFLGRVAEYKDVLNYLAEGSVALGVFGTSERGQWVITNKIFEAMTFGKPILSADVSAMHELFTDKENILFCKMGDAEDLASKILLLKNDLALRQKIGEAALELFKSRLTPPMLVREFLVDLKQKI
jgi:glycosyltransferase involved in cell wall biosynthesis